MGVLVTPENQLFDLRLGLRLQAQASQQNDISDISIRRARLNLLATFKNGSFVSADIRNDRINDSTSADNGFELGDAFYQYNLDKNHNMRFFRTKADVSRSQTSSSAHLILLDRSGVADFSSNFIVESRRAPNIQLNAKFKYLSYQVLVGDSFTNDSFIDSQGNNNTSIEKKNLAYGAKLKLYPLGFSEKTAQETYYGEGKHFSIGVGYFATRGVEYRINSQNYEINRSLLNIEAAIHYEYLNIFAEFFQFNGQVDDFNGLNRLGSSSGYYVMSEIFIPKTKIAPYFRYESWDQFEQDQSTDQYQRVFGINWYKNKDKIRFGAAYSLNSYERGDLREEKIQIYFLFVKYVF